MSAILIIPYPRRNQDGSKNAKLYPWWEKVIEELKRTYNLIQLGEKGEKELVEDVRFNYTKQQHTELLKNSLTFVSVDTWYPHFARKIRPGVVIWGKSNPDIYGYPEHFNIFKDRKYFRKEQFKTWTTEKYEEHVFIEPEIVVQSVETCVKFLTQAGA